MRYEFEPNVGFRFFDGDISLRTHAWATFKESSRIGASELHSVFRPLMQYASDIGLFDPLGEVFAPPLVESDFALRRNLPFHKFVPDATLANYRQGTFWFGSTDHYRTIEQEDSRDRMEGLANLVIQGPRITACVSVSSAFNFAIFCGTTRANDAATMTQKFGRHRIRIRNLKSFAERVAMLINARRFYFALVRYRDLKLFRFRTLKTLSLTNIGGQFDPSMMDRKVFRALFDNSFLPSLFVKPTRFEDENELRLVFELQSDLNGVLKINDALLAGEIEYLD